MYINLLYFHMNLQITLVKQKRCTTFLGQSRSSNMDLTHNSVQCHQLPQGVIILTVKIFTI